MRVAVAWGQQQLELDVLDKNLVQPRRAPAAPSVPDPIQRMREILEHPLSYPALRRALTPEDHIVVVVDEHLPHLSGLLIPLLEHLRQADIRPDAITLLCLPPSTGQAWLDELPDDFQDVRIEVHQPGDRRKLAYLATTKQGRRIYLNRSAVEADQLVLLTRRSYDPLAGYAGAEAMLYPGLGDDAAIQEFAARLDYRSPGKKALPIQQEAQEVAWLVGAPFFVQVIEGSGSEIDSILAGPLESMREGQRLLDARWRVTVESRADVVIASVTGDPASHTIEDLARAFYSAARVVEPGGSIVLLTDAAPVLTRSFEIFRQHDDPGEALTVLRQEKPGDLAAGFMWASAAQQAKLYLLSHLPVELAEELFTVPLQNAQQARKLLTEHATCLILPDTHKTLAVIEKHS
jgi:nickel-dependent lactate racemase